MNLTLAQQQAIAARGNVLVMAGAGTGKTSTLVERCLDCLLDPQNPASLEEILMVTFTDAAAAQMRQRIRARLEAKVAEHPGDLRWPEQLALFDTAHLGTLHSFCLQLVRQHFYELELDPQLAVMPEEESRLLADETMEKILEEHYAGKTPKAAEVQQLIQTQGGGWDQPIRDLVMRLHHYTQTLRDPETWVERQLQLFRSPEPVQWRAWLESAIAGWRARWLPVLQNELSGNEKAAECADILAKYPAPLTARQAAELLKQILQASQVWPPKKKGALGKPLAPFFSEAAFLETLARDEAPLDPLAQDWQWVRGQMITLLELTREFSVAYANSKRELASLDFHDLEQHALRLLWNRDTGQPSAAALEWRRKLRYVFVDEYQDINEAQDAILTALSRDGGQANRFLVGDVKQSIYRFRLADPRIFQNYVTAWAGENGRVIPLTDNFRSRESILAFVNSLFATLMRAEIGGVPYPEDAHLRFGDPENRAVLGRAHNGTPRVELHLRVKRTAGDDAAEDEAGDKTSRTELANLEEAAREARLTAFRLRELKNSGHLIWDEAEKKMRPVAWSDMAILLRSMRGKAESFAREFARLGIPLTVTRGNFYESLEISDLLSLFQLLDNPLQDLPALAVLRSPLVGMSVDDLAAIRLALPKAHFWSALLRFHERQSEHPAWPAADRFLRNHAHWRRLARQSSLARCLETVLDETHYADWLLTQPRGAQRHANVRRLVALAREFDQFQRQGLFRFLRFVEAQQEAETEPQVAAVSGDDAVRLMSIHQSKGLEFPVVAVADLAKPFNLSDLRAEIILDPELGLCPRIKPPQAGRRYPSLPYWMAAQRQKRDSLGEEMRLLYVAMTRARDTLILTGAVSEKQLETEADSPGLSVTKLLAARSYLDWIFLWLASAAEKPLTAVTGENQWLQWNLYEPLDARLRDDSADADGNAQSQKTAGEGDEKKLADLRARLAWEYPHPWAVKQAAKTSVTALRRQWAEQMAEAQPLASLQSLKFNPPSSHARDFGATRISAADKGTAHHVFLQWMNLELGGTGNLIGGLKAEAHRLQLAGLLTADETSQLDFEALAAFWNSDLGKKIREQRAFVKRELPFTARFSPEEISFAQANAEHLTLRLRDDTSAGQAALSPSDGAREISAGQGNLSATAMPASVAIRDVKPSADEPEFVVVQGVADLVVLLPREIWLVDFKTDRMTGADLPDKIKQYEPQLRLYALALARIYHRPVTGSWLHFLEIQRSQKIEIGQDARD